MEKKCRKTREKNNVINQLTRHASIYLGRVTRNNNIVIMMTIMT